jgi:hypothetical protein
MDSNDNEVDKIPKNQNDYNNQQASAGGSRL